MNPLFQAFSTRAANSSSRVELEVCLDPSLIVMADLESLGNRNTFVSVMSPENHRVLPVVLEADATKVQLVPVAA